MLFFTALWGLVGGAGTAMARGAAAWLNWFDTDWIGVSLLLIATSGYRLIRHEGSAAVSLTLQIALGWWAGFLLLSVLLGLVAGDGTRQRHSDSDQLVERHGAIVWVRFRRWRGGGDEPSGAGPGGREDAAWLGRLGPGLSRRFSAAGGYLREHRREPQRRVAEWHCPGTGLRDTGGLVVELGVCAGGSTRVGVGPGAVAFVVFVWWILLGNLSRLTPFHE
jgi:hypothetical protein